MDLPATIYAVRWFIRDTFRQAWASRLSWFLLGVSAIFIFVCFSVGVSGGVELQRDGAQVDFLPREDPLANVARTSTKGVTVLDGDLTILFGLIRVPLGRDAGDAVRYLQLLLAGGVADTLGILLALIWTAGFLPTFLDPSTAVVLLARPVPRWTLLAGKYLGVLAFVGFQASVFVGGTWFALAVRTGYSDMAYLQTIPLLLLHFSIFFSVSLLLAVLTRSTITCVLGSLLFWFLCWGINYGRHLALLLPESSGIASTFVALVDATYWILPKPADLGIVLFDALGAGKSFSRLDVFEAIQKQGAFAPFLSVLTSLLFAVAMLAAASWEFARTDY
jgi:ABC-type transport system involved in multi-copper enzyme maturation permease subunit